MNETNSNHDIINPKPHQWLTTESKGDPELLALLENREKVIDTLASREEDPDIYQDTLQKLSADIIVRKNQLGIETLPPLPPNNENSGSV